MLLTHPEDSGEGGRGEEEEEEEEEEQDLEEEIVLNHDVSTAYG
jgi:hypothetical protein